MLRALLQPAAPAHVPAAPANTTTSQRSSGALGGRLGSCLGSQFRGVRQSGAAGAEGAEEAEEAVLHEALKRKLSQEELENEILREFGAPSPHEAKAGSVGYGGLSPRQRQAARASARRGFALEEPQAAARKPNPIATFTVSGGVKGSFTAEIFLDRVPITYALFSGWSMSAQSLAIATRCFDVAATSRVRETTHLDHHVHSQCPLSRQLSAPASAHTPMHPLVWW